MGWDKNAPKREITIRFFNIDLLNFYYSLPYKPKNSNYRGKFKELFRKNEYLI